MSDDSFSGKDEDPENAFWRWYLWRWPKALLFAAVFWLVAYAVYHFFLRG